MVVVLTAGVSFPPEVYGKTGTAQYGTGTAQYGTGPNPPPHGLVHRLPGRCGFAVLVEGGASGPTA